MGKKKDKKFGAAKPQPTGLPSINDDSDESEMMMDSSSSSSVVADVLDQLMSAEESTRECGCGTLAALASQPGALPILLSNNVVRIVAPLVIDPSPCVRHRALGALRNMTVDGGFDVCHEMVLKDVLTPLVALFKQYGVSWEPQKRKKGLKHTDTQLDIFLQAVHVLWNLCEASDIAVTVFNKENLLPVLLPCLQHSVYGYPLATAVAQCLQTVTENNTMATEVCRGDSVLPALKGLMDNVADTSSDALLFKAAVMGILMNVLGEGVMSGSSLTTFILTISHTLQVNVHALITNYVAKKPEQNGVETGFRDACEQNGAASPLGDSGDCHPHTLVEEEVIPRDQDFVDMVHAVDAQRLCLELLTNMCCSPEEEWQELDSSESGSSDELTGEAEMDQDMTVDNNNLNPVCVPSEVQAAFTANDIIAKVSGLSLSLPADLAAVVSSRKWGKTISKKLRVLRTHALLCLNNVVQMLPDASEDSTHHLHQMWDTLTLQLKTTGADGSSAPNPEVTGDLDLLEGLTGAMRAVVQRLGHLQSPRLAQVTPGDVHFLVRLAEGATSSVQIHVARIVATIAQLMAKSDPTHSVVQEVGSCLMGAASHSTDLVVVAEALDCLFDVFADDATDPLAQRLQLTQKLRDIMPLLKARLQNQKKALGENYVTVVTARTNLLRFIKYKESQGSS